MADLTTILPVTLKFEGLWSDNPKDPGGCTMKGIILTTYRQYKPGATPGDLRCISDAEVEHIYDVGYFQKISGPSLSQGVGMVSFDDAVNSGEGAANKLLKKTANLTGSARVQAISNERLSFLRALKTWSYFGKGWGARVGECEAIGIRWESATPEAAKLEITKAVAVANKKVRAHAVVIASSTVAVTPAALAPAKLIPLGVIAPLGVLLIITVLICGLLAFHNSQRATALKAA